jgi:hypothetical protein
MSKKIFSLSTKLWLYPGKIGWHFLSLPPEVAAEIEDRYSFNKRGWGSLRVQVTVGSTIWKTSIFPDKKNKTYLLPVKKEVRQQESFGDGDVVKYQLQVLE